VYTKGSLTCEADHLPSSDEKVKNECSPTSAPPMSSWHVEEQYYLSYHFI